jgi:hypothetical protein
MENREQGGYVTFGLPWKQGELSNDDGMQRFSLCVDGMNTAVQSEAAASWPDGTLKWTRHCANIPQSSNEIEMTVRAEEEDPVRETACKVTRLGDRYQIDTQVMTAEFPFQGTNLIEHVVLQGRESVREGVLCCVLEERSQDEGERICREVTYKSVVRSVEIEEVGSLKVVVKVTGTHLNPKTGRDIFPFIVRFVCHAGESMISVMHTFLYDGDEQKDFIKGIGLQLHCPTEGALYNRHVKVGGDFGYVHEALQLLSCRIPRVDYEIYQAQMRGEMIEPDASPVLEKALEDITVWGNYRIYQQSDMSYQIKKRTGKENCRFIQITAGKRSKGAVSFSGERGGVMVGMRHFWEKYPSAIWMDGLDQEMAVITAWILPPDAESCDLRHYDTVAHEKAYYEGFDEVRATPYGIANTNELLIVPFVDSVPSDEQLDCWNLHLQKPPVLLADPSYYHEAGAFGKWSLPCTDTPKKEWFEKQLDLAVDFYKKEIETRHWYGLFDYGDFMHTYDRDRHCWRYDMGGFAWQNTELVPTLWLWYAFLRSGREDIYTLAEAMSRHAADVDTYHIGQYKGIGSRHNVSHWGCSCKEARIAMAGHHRVLYYISGDMRMADIFDDVKDGDFSLLNIDPLRTFYPREGMKYPTHARTGPDWSSFTSNWMTEWERHQNTDYRDKILVGIADLKKSPYQLFSGSDYEYDPASGHLGYIGETGVGSHLALCMGAPQIWFELAELLEDEEWNRMLADYGVFYYDDVETKRKKTNGAFGEKGFSFPYMAAAMAAYGARYYQNAELAKKVWEVLWSDVGGEYGKKGFCGTRIEQCVNRKDYEEIPWISTNFVSQWCLNVIVCLELVGAYLD